MKSAFRTIANNLTVDELIQWADYELNTTITKPTGDEIIDGEDGKTGVISIIMKALSALKYPTDLAKNKLADIYYLRTRIKLK